MERKTEILSFFTNPDFRQSQILLNSIIEKAYQIAVKYLHYHQKKIINLLFREEITVQELAIDSIAELFIKSENEDLNLLQQTFLGWQPAINTEEDVLFFLNKVVAGKVEQNIIKLLKAEDPFFSKLLDSINYLIKQNGFKKIHFLGKTFISETELNSFDGEFITREAFDNLPSELFTPKQYALKTILNYLKAETNYNPAIPLNDLVCRLKQINFSDYLSVDYENVLSKKIEIKEFLDIGLKAVDEKLIAAYLNKDKLTEQEVFAIKAALKEMAVDMSNGGLSPGLYEYLSPHISGLTKLMYKEKYHNILEYLLKVMKSKIADELTGKK